MFFQFIRVGLIWLIIFTYNVYAKENNTKYSKPFVSFGKNFFHIGAVAFSPDGKYLVSGSSKLIIWDIESGKELKHTQDDSDGSITSLSFSPDGKYLLSGGYHQAIKVWDTKTWKIVKKFYSDTETNYLSFSLDMKYILSGHNPNQYYQSSGTWKYELWEIASGEKLKDFNHTVDKETLAQFGIQKKDIKPLCITVPVKELRKMDKQIDEIKKDKDESYSLRFAKYSPNKKYVISLHFIAVLGRYDLPLVLWDAQTMKIVKKFKNSSFSHFYSMDINPNNGNILTADNNTIKLWNPSDGTLIKTYLDYTKDSYDSRTGTRAKYNKNGTKIIVSLGHDIKIIDSNTNEIIKNFKDSGDDITFIKLSLDEKYLFIGERLKILKVLEVESGNEIQSTDGYLMMRDIVLTPNEKYVLSSETSPEQLKLWSIKTGKVIQEFNTSDVYTTALAIDSLGKYAASGNLNHKRNPLLKLWNIKDAKEEKRFQGHTDWINSLAFSPNNQYLLSGSVDKTLRLWDIESGNIKKIFHGGFEGIQRVAFNSNMTQIYSVNYEGIIKIWDINTGEELLEMMNFDDGEWLSITPEGYFNGSKGVAKHLRMTKYIADEMEAVSSSQLYNHFFRPDLVKLKLSGDEEAYKKVIERIFYP